jgi:hypothetical protein
VKVLETGANKKHTPKEHALVRLLLLPWQVAEAVKTNKDLPTALQQWATKWLE